MSGHLVAHCPTIRCSRCDKLGHSIHVCQNLLLWQYVASMCGFQSSGHGFFYFPDTSTPKQLKEKASTVIITVVEGVVSGRDIEVEFNGGFFGAGWRCTARAIGPKQFSMRFPNPKEVERACYWGKRMEMKTKEVVLNLSPWSDSVRATAQLQKAWVRIRNIPFEKRCEAHAFYVASLVGMPSGIDSSTLYRPEYVKVLIGCRNMDKIPEKAEGCLGD
uniref:Uncharacterized protein n=1 Tax=Avena sativa TaxID=4498 RepID=A0ACD5Y0P2_AVESA